MSQGTTPEKGNATLRRARIKKSLKFISMELFDLVPLRHFWGTVSGAVYERINIPRVNNAQLFHVDPGVDNDLSKDTPERRIHEPFDVVTVVFVLQ